MRIFHATLILFTFGITLFGRAVPINVLATGDMHGWLEPQQVDGQWLGGSAEMLAYWKKVEHYTPKQFLVVGCGDTATGPALATVLKNGPVLGVMNIMGYDACAVGNHEFDYSRALLDTWQKTAHFPFISANLVNKDGTPSEFSPYMMYEEQGVKVAVIGLTTSDVAEIASTNGLSGTSYAKALRKWVPEARAKGAQTVIVVAHVPMQPLIELSQQVADLKIPLMLGGHSHELGQMKIGDTWIVNTGQWWDSYSRINLDYNPQTGKTVVLAANQVWLQQGKARADRAVTTEINRWKAQFDTDYNTPIGYTATGLQRNAGVPNFITDCWLTQYPTNDMAFSNMGGFRQDLPPGTVTKSTLIGIMPFSNSLQQITLSGEQLLAFLPRDGSIYMAGIRLVKGQYQFIKTGQPVDPAATYHVLINNYYYNVSRVLTTADTAPVTVADDWRQPVYDWLAAHPTSKDTPLESLVDVKGRGE